MKTNKNLETDYMKIINKEKCMTIGYSDENKMDIGVDEDNSLIIKNGNTEDIDVFIPKINLLSNAETTALNTGALVVYGGLSIIKNIRIGDGIVFGKENNIKNKLSEFEEDEIEMGGIWKNNNLTKIIYQKIGRKITMEIISIVDDAVNKDIIKAKLPLNICPKRKYINQILVIDNNEEKIGRIIIDEKGIINICSENNSKFSGIGKNGFNNIDINFIL